MFTKRFWQDATERAVKTAAQVIVTLGVGGALNILTIDWEATIGLSLGGALLSYATSIVSAGVTKHDSPSLVEAKPQDDRFDIFDNEEA